MAKPSECRPNSKSVSGTARRASGIPARSFAWSHSRPAKEVGGMERIAEATVRFEFTAGAVVTFCDPLELSLDCPVCRRCCRTVVFREGESEGRCSPTGHAFPGRIIARQVAQDGAVASI